jgi:hypothetical protein
MSLLKSFFGGGQTAAKGSASAIDVVTYIASLASEPKAIDPLLDSLREVTSRIKPGTPLSDIDQKTLASVCRQLITYLLEKDQLRTFDKATLQQKISQKFPQPSPAEKAFWTQLNGLLI